MDWINDKYKGEKNKMVLKSNEVVNKTFDSSMFGGFKKEEVTSYMHLVASTLSNYEKLVTEYAQGDYKKKAQILDSNKEKIDELIKQSEQKAKANLENAAKQIQVEKATAAKECEQMKEDARREAQEIIRSAKAKAQATIDNASAVVNNLLNTAADEHNALKDRYELMREEITGWHDYASNAANKLLASLSSEDWKDVLNTNMQEVDLREQFENLENHAVADIQEEKQPLVIDEVIAKVETKEEEEPSEQDPLKAFDNLQVVDPLAEAIKEANEVAKEVETNFEGE